MHADDVRRTICLCARAFVDGLKKYLNLGGGARYMHKHTLTHEGPQAVCVCAIHMNATQAVTRRRSKKLPTFPSLLFSSGHRVEYMKGRSFIDSLSRECQDGFELRAQILEYNMCSVWEYTLARYS